MDVNTHLRGQSNRILIIDADVRSHPQYRRLGNTETQVVICDDYELGRREFMTAYQHGRSFALVIIALAADRQTAGLGLAGDIDKLDRSVGLVVTGQAGRRFPLGKVTDATPVEPWLYLEKPLRIRELRHLTFYLINRFLKDRALQRSARQLAGAQQLFGFGYWLWYPDAERAEWCPQLGTIFELPVQTQSGPIDMIWSRIHPRDRLRVRMDLGRMVTGKVVRPVEYKIVLNDGHSQRMRQLSQLHLDPDSGERYLTSAVLMVTEHGHGHGDRALQKLEYFDSQTDLPNRNFLNEYLQHVLLHVRRHHRQMAVLHVNLDGFRRVNDDLGQDTGDALLREVAWRLESGVRDSDCITREQANPLWPSLLASASDAITRYGDDEFMILLTEIEGVEDPKRIGERLVDRVAQPISIGDQQFSISASIGFAVYPDHAEEEDMLLRNAALALQAAKRAGRNTCRCYNEQMVKPAHGSFMLENQLREALDTGGLCLHYQPKIDLASGELAGCEALLRWQHPQLGPIPPAEFIPVAEQSGLILDLGEWVIMTVCEQLRSWRGKGMDELTVAVNVSAQQFQDYALVAKISRMMRDSGITPARLQFEITESILMEESGASVEQLAELRALGCSVAMDDFGTGYSSLGYLKRLPLDVVKIDRSFVRDILDDRDDQVILEAIISMAHQLRLTVVAEGVENHQQLEYLKSVNCDQIQGYVISAPVPAQEFTQAVVAGHRVIERAAE